MILLKIFDTKDMMSQLLLQETFDEWLLVEAQVTTFAKMTIAGHRNKQWYDEEMSYPDLLYWKEARSYLFHYIKGKRTPAFFTISLKLSAGMAQRIIEDEALLKKIREKKIELLLQFKYEKDNLYIVTGISQLEFTMDKRDEISWDATIPQLLKQLKISFE